MVRKNSDGIGAGGSGPQATPELRDQGARQSGVNYGRLEWLFLTKPEYGAVKIPGLILTAAGIAVILAVGTLVTLYKTIFVQHELTAGGGPIPQIITAETALYFAFLSWGVYRLLRRGSYTVLLITVVLHVVFSSALVARFNGDWEMHLWSSIVFGTILLSLLCLRSSRQYHQTCGEAKTCQLISNAATFTPRIWWSEHELVNGVFKGGGAKGIAYAGALDAMNERELWFGSVAGTSAGAITATLIACGCDPHDMKSLVPSLLRSIKPTKLAMILGTRATLFDSRTLRIKLEQILCDGVGRSLRMYSPVTFRELHNAHSRKISLYVVALDLSRAAPVVFSVHTTPEVSVSAAVMASSAIPVGFPSVRGIFRKGDTIWVQRLVDGGAWANLPRFVYYDPSFAAWIRKINPTARIDEESRRPTVGFALGLDDTTIIQPDILTLDSTGAPEFDKGTTQETGSRWMWAFGEIFSSQMMRFLIGAALVSIAAVLIVNTHGAVNSFWELIPADTKKRLDDQFTPLIANLYITTVFMGCILPLLAVLFSRPAGDVLIPAGRAALSAGTGVAPWVGAADDDHIIRLDPGKLKTTDFSPKVADQEAAISDARERTLAYVDRFLRPQRPVDVSAIDSDYAQASGSRSVLLHKRTGWTRIVDSTPQLVLDMTRLYGSPILTFGLGIIALVMFVYSGQAIVYEGRRDLDYWAAAALALGSLVVISWLVTVIMMRWQRQIARRPTKYTLISRIPALSMVIVGFVMASAVLFQEFGLFVKTPPPQYYSARVIGVKGPTLDKTGVTLWAVPVESGGDKPGDEGRSRTIIFPNRAAGPPVVGDVIRVKKRPAEKKPKKGRVESVLIFLMGLWLVRVGLWPLRIIGRDRGLRSIRY